MWLVLGLGFVAVSALTGPASAEPATPFAVGAAAQQTATPSPTPGGVACTPTLTASPSIIGAGQTTTLTFDDACVCIDPPTSGTVCDYFPFALVSIDAPGFTTPNTPIFPPVPYEIQVTATDIGMRTITVSYDGETEFEPPGVYIRRTLQASVDVLVLEPTPTPPVTPTQVAGTPTPTPPPSPTPTPTPTPPNVQIRCDEFLTFSDTNPTVGDTIDVTFNSNCRCEPMNVPGSSCYFAQFQVDSITAPAFDVPNTPFGPPAPSTVQITATTAGLSEVTMRYYGEDFMNPPGFFNFTYRQASEFIEVREAPGANTTLTTAVSCLAGNGRVDFNIVNEGTAPADYRIVFAGLTPRQRTVQPGDWWRMPVTGRADDLHPILVTRDTETVDDRIIEISCDDAVPDVSTPEVSIVNACRDGLGYLLFQFVNPTSSPNGYVIAFENVPNRSTTAAAYGQSVRAVTGRPDGDHSYVVRRDGVVIDGGSVAVDCS